MPPRKSARRAPNAAAIPDQVLAAVRGQPWAITPQGMDLVLAVVSRGTLMPEALETRRGAALRNTRTTTMRDGVALVPVHGPLVARASLFEDISGATSYSTIMADVQAAADDPAVSAIVLCMASPGGQVHGCGEAAQALLAVRGRKPLIAFVEGDACSAAYWLASACDEIVAADTAILGCLGTQVAYLDDEEFMARTGFREVVITSSQTPDKNVPPTNESGRAAHQTLVDDIASVFLDSVAANRGVDRAYVDAHFGRGAVLVGERALAAGLADRLGTYEVLHDELARGAWHNPRASLAARGAALTSTETSFMRRTVARTASASASADPALHSPAPTAAAIESGTSVRALVTRDVAVAEGDVGTIVEIVDGSFYAVDFGEGDSSTYRYFAEGDLAIADATVDPNADPIAPATGATRQTTAQRLRAEGAAAEQARVSGILALIRPGITLERVLPLITDPTCTPEGAAHRVLTGAVAGVPSTLLAQLAGDEAQVTGLSPIVAGAAALSDAERILAVTKQFNPGALASTPRG